MSEFVNVQEIDTKTFERPDITWIKRVINETDNDEVYVKVSNGQERFWANVDRVEGGKLYCTVANDLVWPCGYDFRDPIVVEFDNIYDVYVGEGSLESMGEENLEMVHNTCNKVKATVE